MIWVPENASRISSGSAPIPSGLPCRGRGAWRAWCRRRDHQRRRRKSVVSHSRKATVFRTLTTVTAFNRPNAVRSREQHPRYSDKNTVTGSYFRLEMVSRNGSLDNRQWRPSASRMYGRQANCPPASHLPLKTSLLATNAHIEGEPDQAQRPLAVWGHTVLHRPEPGHPVLRLGVAAREGCRSATD